MKAIVLKNPAKNADAVDVATILVSTENGHPAKAVRKALRSRLTELVISKIEQDTLLVFATAREGLETGFEPVAPANLPSFVRDEIERYWQYLEARSFAQERHGDQKYSSLKLPYYYHLKQTDKVVDRFVLELPAGKTLELKMAALLHDILEDTPTTAREIEDKFGAEVADIVVKVTKVDEEHTPEYEAAYYAQVAQNPLAVYIKIADKCANTKQTVKAFSEWHARRIIDGHKTFQDYTYAKIPDSSLKAYLDGLVKKLERHHD